MKPHSWTCVLHTIYTHPKGSALYRERLDAVQVGCLLYTDIIGEVLTSYDKSRRVYDVSRPVCRKNCR